MTIKRYVSNKSQPEAGRLSPFITGEGLRDEVVAEDDILLLF
jgi:hypothetical protein